MKPRTQFYITIGLLILIFGIVWLTFSVRSQEPIPTFSATIRRDCAPWDGSAFTVSIPLREGAGIDISIYRSPDIRLPVTYSFPDETMRDGNALLLLPAILPEQLTGRVQFQRVEQGVPVEGTFNLHTEMGQQFKGRFRAEWNEQPAYCG